jgi:hypothetical protein
MEHEEGERVWRMSLEKAIVYILTSRSCTTNLLSFPGRKHASGTHSCSYQQKTNLRNHYNFRDHPLLLNRRIS